MVGVGQRVERDMAYLFGHDDIEIVLGLVDVGAHRYYAGDACGVCLGWSSRWRVHDAVLGASEEVCRASQAIEHS